MSWVRIDDGFFRHPKAIRAGRDGRILFIASICYAGSNLTDGFVPEGALTFLAAETGICKPKAAAELLVDAGLWERTDGGWLVHDYLDYNTASGKVHAERDAARERMKAKRSANVRPNNPRSSPEVRQPETEVETETERSYEPNGSQERDTPPTPSPEGESPKPKRSRSRAMTTIPDDFEPSPEMVAKACETYGLTPEQVTAKTERFRRWAVSKNQTYADWGMGWLNFMEPKPWDGDAPPQPLRPKLPDGVSWNEVAEWRTRLLANFPITDEQQRILDRLDGKAAA